MDLVGMETAPPMDWPQRRTKAQRFFMRTRCPSVLHNQHTHHRSLGPAGVRTFLQLLRTEGCDIMAEVVTCQRQSSLDSHKFLETHGFSTVITLKGLLVQGSLALISSLLSGVMCLLPQTRWAWIHCSTFKRTEFMGSPRLSPPNALCSQPQQLKNTDLAFQCPPWSMAAGIFLSIGRASSPSTNCLLLYLGTSLPSH